MRIVLLDSGTARAERQEYLFALAGLLQRQPDTEILFLCPRGSAFAERLKSERFPFVPLPGSAWYNPFAVSALRRELDAFGPTCVHAFGGAAARFAGRGLSRCNPASTRLVVSLPARPFAEPDTPLTRPEQIPGPAARSALAAVLCPSAWSADALRKAGFPSTLLHVVLPALAPREDSKNPLPLHLPRRHWVFLTALPGRSTRGLSTLLEAMAYLRDRTDLPPWEMRILCTPDRFGSIRAKARAKKLEERLCLLGGQNLSQQLSLCDIAITTDTACDEHHVFPLHVWRAARPLICPATAPFLDIAGDERTALFYKPGNAAALASDMLRCMIDPNLYRRLRRLGLRRFASRTLDAVAWQILGIYQHIQC
ncbi:MAG TPA: glycosyltransferase [Candidatus Avidesulfovibrio excrementigallinarum]|nr:glycosyltransferase [Candidatus Avidesulfovibrio excrementigallinarum]